MQIAAKAALRRPMPPDSADLFQLEMQASPQEEV